MFETVTVDEAIKKGQRMINLPVAIIMFGIMGVAVLLSVNNYISSWLLGVLVAAGFILAWLYWSFAITKWRLWAFENVRNVHELQRKAIEAKLIWPESSFWEKTEIRNAAQKQKWSFLQTKFNNNDVYSDDVTVPPETVIYFSKGAIAVQIVVMFLVLCVGIYLFYTHNNIGGTALSAIALYFIYSEIKKANNKKPQIIINDKGVETPDAGFSEWKDIQNENVITRSSGKSSNTYFEYNCPGASVSINIEEMDTNKKALENLLHTYRVRSEKKK